MNDNEFSKVGLYEHNAKSYRKIREAYESGEKVVGIVHATGTGKTYNALQLAYDNKDKKIIYVVPSESVIEHVKSIVENNPNLSMDDFKNVEFRTYQSFINMSREELSEIDCDLLILDEFHHLGAPVWGARINAIVETHSDMLVFGMTAYTVRDRGTPYERDMANPDGSELFSNKIVSRYDLVDAMLDGVLPMDVIYRTAYTNLLGLEKELENKINNTKATKEELEEYRRILDAAKKRVAEAPGVAEVVRKYVKPNGKYIYFCPPRSEDGINDINTIMNEAYEWFSQYVPAEDIEFYVTTSSMREEGKHNRDMFYNDMTLDGKDASKKLRVMFAINQYNEGVHAPNIDGVIMGRGTKSDIVFFEQLGRALAVRGNVIEKYKEYESYSYDELVSLAKEKEMTVSTEMMKEDIIEKLIAPVIIDLTNNIEFIKQLEENLKDRIKERREKSLGSAKETSKLREVSFDIDIVNEDLYRVLSNLRNRVYRDWNSMYELAKRYYEKHGNLLVKRNFKTTNGYEEDENGVNLGAWINTQRYKFNRGELSQERIDKLNKIGMVFNPRKELTKKKVSVWEQLYGYAKDYYEKHGNLNVPYSYEVTTLNGETVSLRIWINKQEDALRFGKLNSVKGKKLALIGINVQVLDQYWLYMYKLSKAYYQTYGNLDIPYDFKTKNGYKSYSLGKWIYEERNNLIYCQMDLAKLYKWGELCSDPGIFIGKFDTMYDLADRYFAIYRHLDVSIDFKTKDGCTYDESGYYLGVWLAIYGHIYNDGRLDEDKVNAFSNAGMIFDDSEEYFEKMYQKAFEYYNKNGHLDITQYYKTEDGANLGVWLYRQKYLLGLNRLSKDKIDKLKDIGVISGFRSGFDEQDFDLMCELTKKHYNFYGNLTNAKDERFMTLDGITPSLDGYNLGLWIIMQEKLLAENKLSQEKISKLGAVGIAPENVNEQIETLLDMHDFNWDSIYELFAKVYYQHYGNLNVPTDFRTIDGYTEDVRGFRLGKWVEQQINDYHAGKLTKEQISKLMNIGIVFTVEDTLWDNFYKLAEVYYQHHGNLMMDINFKTINGYEYDAKGVELGAWLHKQEKLLLDKKLNGYKKEKLEKIGLRVEDIEREYFEEMYQKAKEFYNEHGHLDPMYEYRHSSSVKKWSPEAEELLIWTLTCKRACNKGIFGEELRKRLEDIGLFLKQYEIDWNHMYNLAKKYCMHHGNLDVPEGFKTYDGYTYDETGLDLSKWLINQRVKFKNKKLDDEKILKLDVIGMYWEIRTNKQENKHMCVRYGIDYKLNKNVLERISNVELISKINFLIQRDESITKDGILHEIFSMSSIVMKGTYGLNLEELINEFYTFRNRKRLI